MTRVEIDRARRMLELVRLLSSVVVVPTSEADKAKFTYAEAMKGK